ncbi:protein slx4 [Aspergillus fijiensis CBS 313.89]|uniref:Structure-specific endonuclease subunit SLX4 n=1 Tax=Aspergillus fijiensis CBS 313.89 TaxID=1448319 RepID=A0A8G1RYF0_9EURO|nr:uncharacterized protein BO72DRAFT_525054 [Aspergillus fijiensis CBS 313.89]RAK80573.1 hypothetical protein BO72DRAFT_525054 [Aspergillus fijiensis CBS 313.89]
MTATAEVIVLLSSPEHSPVNTPAPPKYDAQQLFGLSPIDTSTSQPPSPSDLFQDPTRSKFFEGGKQPSKRARKTPNAACKTTDVEGADATGAKDGPPEEKVKKRGRPKKKPEEGVEESSHTGEGPSKKSLSKKPTTRERKPKVPKTTMKRATAANKTISGRVAKAGSSSQPIEGQSGKKPDCPSTPQLSLDQNSANDTRDWEKDGLQLEQALKRRLDWTPTDGTIEQTSGLDIKLDHNSNEMKSFGTMLSEFGFGGISAPQAMNQVLEENGPTKRRRIELIDARVYPGNKPKTNESSENHSTEDETSSSKAPAAKKKATKPKKFSTLTARVTAQYLTNGTEAMDNSEGSSSASMPSALTSRKLTTKKGKNARAQEPELVILSPEAAVRSLEDQELVFGTCSQLEREDSPTMIRELQTAIRESEQSLALETSIRVNNGANESLPLTVSRFTASRNLWSVAARDVDGSVLPVEVVDLVDGSDTPKPCSAVNNGDSKEKKDKNVSAISNEAVVPDAQRSREDLSTSAPETSDTLDRQAGVGTSQPRARQPKMPHFSGFTDAQLSKRVASYGFKPIKSRPKMIEILTKCWESKHGTAAPCVPGNLPPQPPTSASSETVIPKTSAKGTRSQKNTTTKKVDAKPKPKKSDAITESTIKPTAARSIPPEPSQTPTKPSHSSLTNIVTSTISFADVEEIQDSEEDESIPSPSRLQERYLLQHAAPQPSLPTTTTTIPPTSSKIKPLILSRKTTDSATTLSLEAPSLHNQITQAVHVQPRLRPTSINRQPSWHEKILMYDPIILEDFTTWLNTEGLGLVNEDREVGAALVKEWCEGRGVCCCYRPKGRDR